MSMQAKSKPRRLLIAAIAFAAVAPAWGASVGSVSVMDPEEVADGALRARAKAQIRSEQGVSEGGGKIITGDKCGDVNVGNVQQASKVGGAVKNNVIIEGSIFNECR